MYLLDSDFLINLLKKDSKSQKILTNLTQKSAIPFTTSVICVAEIQEGLLATKSKNKLKHFESLTQNMLLLSITNSTAQTFAKTRFNLRKKGQLIDNMDLLIAATCIEHNLTLVTYNKKHFGRIPGLKIHNPES